MTDDRKTGANSGLAKGGLSCFVETFVQGSTFLLRMNSSAKNPPQRKAANRSSRFDLLNLLNSQTEGEKKSPHQIKIEGFFQYSSKLLITSISFRHQVIHSL